MKLRRDRRRPFGRAWPIDLFSLEVAGVNGALEYRAAPDTQDTADWRLLKRAM